MELVVQDYQATPLGHGEGESEDVGRVGGALSPASGVADHPVV